MVLVNARLPFRFGGRGTDEIGEEGLGFVAVGPLLAGVVEAVVMVIPGAVDDVVAGEGGVVGVFLQRPVILGHFGHVVGVAVDVVAEPDPGVGTVGGDARPVGLGQVLLVATTEGDGRYRRRGDGGAADGFRHDVLRNAGLVEEVGDKGQREGQQEFGEGFKHSGGGRVR